MPNLGLALPVCLAHEEDKSTSPRSCAESSREQIGNNHVMASTMSNIEETVRFENPSSKTSLAASRCRLLAEPK